MGINVELAEVMTQSAHQAGIGKLGWGEIERQPQPGEMGLQLPKPLQRETDQLIAEDVHAAMVLGQIQEHIRCDRTKPRVVPAGQCLHAVQGQTAIHDRLKLHPQSPVTDRRHQIHKQVVVVQLNVAIVHIEDGNPGMAQLLGPIHRDIGALHRHRRIGFGGVHHVHADADVEIHLDLLQPRQAVEASRDAGGQAIGLAA